MSEVASVASKWFDQFPPLLAGVQWDPKSQWCARHWAPAPLMGANGIGASIELMQLYLAEHMPKNLTSPAAMNRHMKAAGNICCLVGDERMFTLWGNWPPAPEPEDSEP
jgi:hypothetical protein